MNASNDLILSYTGSGICKSKRDVAAAVALLKSIEKNKGRLDSRELNEEFVARSRPISAPTHRLFEWNDTKAAHAHRLDQARAVIMSVRVVFQDMPEVPVRAFPVIVFDGKKGPYPVERIRSNQSLMDGYVEMARADLVLWSKRYETLNRMSELGPAFRLANKFKKKKPPEPDPEE